MSDTSWIDLLSSRDPAERLIKVTDNTPKRRQDGGWSKGSDVQVLRCQVASLMKDKRRLTEDALKSRECQAKLERELKDTRRQFEECQRQSDDVCHVLEEQSKLISQLSTVRDDDSQAGGLDELKRDLSQAHDTITTLEQSSVEKDKALEGVYAHVQELRNEVTLLSQHIQTPHTHSTLIKDMERLTLRNAEVSESLVATQHSRTLLERELVSVKQRLSRERDRSAQLEQLIALDSGEGEEIRQLKAALSSKDEELTSALSELTQLKDTQLSTIDAKCQEVDVLRTQMIGQLAAVDQERTELEGQLSAEQRQRAELDGQLSAEQRKRAELEGQLSAEQRKRAELDGQLSAEQRQRAELDRQLSAEQRQRAELEGQLSAEQRQRAELEGQLLAEQRQRAELEVALSQSKDELSSRSEQFCRSKDLCKQLKKESLTLTERIRQLEEQCQQQCLAVDKVKGQLDSTSGELEVVLMEVETNRTDKMILQQKVTDLEGQVESLKTQLVSRSELTNEMKALLDQRAARIKQLERATDRQREELSVAMETAGDLLNASRESMGSMTSLSSSIVNSSTSLSKRSPSRFSTAQAEIVHLKQRLADSRQSTIRLELQCAQLKTEGARLLGSQQALLTIREQLLTENSSLGKGQRSFKETWEKEKDEMTNQIALLHHELNKTREMVSSRDSNNVRVVAMETDLNLSKHEVANLQSELNHVTLDLDHVTVQLDHVTLLLNSEQSFLHQTSHVVSMEISTLRAEATQVQETSHLTEVINLKRSTQIQEHESSLSRLLAEVEVLRARKKVVMDFAREPENRTQEVKGQKILELKSRLKRQKKQTNFVRLRLGYALGELRLYKQLKVAMDTRVSEMQCGLGSLQAQYDSCVVRLRQAELLGFETAQ